MHYLRPDAYPQKKNHSLHRYIISLWIGGRSRANSEYNYMAEAYLIFISLWIDEQVKQVLHIFRKHIFLFDFVKSIVDKHMLLLSVQGTGIFIAHRRFSTRRD